MEMCELLPKILLTSMIITLNNSFHVPKGTQVRFPIKRIVHSHILKTF